VSLEKDLVAECRQRALDLGSWTAEVGQLRAKGSGTTVGYPDMTLYCSGEIVQIELKRAHVANEGHGVLNLGQVAFIEKVASQGVKIHVIDNVDEFTELINWCRRPKGVVRR